MIILVTGANGFLGRHIANTLKRAGHQVRELNRANGGDFERLRTPQAWLPHLDGVEAVVNCVGIIAETSSQRFSVVHGEAPIALFRACVAGGVRRVVQISALGTDDGAASRFHLSKREADDVLRSLSLEWFVLRPSLVVGGKSTGWLRRLANLPVWVLPGTGNQVLQPVHLRDVTDSVLQCLEDHLPPRQTIDLVGPEALSLKEFLLLLRRADQRNAPWIWLIPVNWLMAIAHLAAPFAPLFSPDNLAMLHRSVIADGAPFARLLGRNPYSIEASCREERHELSAT